MTKGEIRKLSLRWADLATVNGVPLSDEISADFNDKFDFYLYHALNFLYGIFREENVFVPENSLEEVSSYKIYELPKNLRAIKKIICTDDDGYFEVIDYKMECKNKILIPKEFKNIRILYYTNCEYISPLSDDDTEIILSDRIAFLLPLKVACDIFASCEDTLVVSTYLSDKFNSFVTNILDEDVEEPKNIGTVLQI